MKKPLNLDPKLIPILRSVIKIIYTTEPDIRCCSGVSLQALDAPLTQGTHNSAIRAIFELYTDETQEEKLVAILEEIKPKMEDSVVMHELMGDLYKKTGDSDKAELAYAKWLKIRLKEVNETERILPALVC